MAARSPLGFIASFGQFIVRETSSILACFDPFIHFVLARVNFVLARYKLFLPDTNCSCPIQIVLARFEMFLPDSKCSYPILNVLALSDREKSSTRISFATLFSIELAIA